MPFKTEVIRLAGFDVHVQRHGAGPGRETIVMVDGPLATGVALRHCARSLQSRYHVVLYDLPCAGRSRALNPRRDIVTLADEVRILRALVDHFGAHHILSVSCGGMAAMLALAGRPPTVRSGIVGSFAPTMNARMRAYLQLARDLVAVGRFPAAATLLNDTFGKHLPQRLKRCNLRHLAAFDRRETPQLLCSIDQLLGLRADDYRGTLSRIGVPVLFINGEADKHTPAEDLLAFRGRLAQTRFATIPGAGHFLAMEGREVGASLRCLVMDFLGEHGIPGTADPPAPATPARAWPPGTVVAA